MRRRLLLLPAVLLSAAVLACPTDNDLKKIEADMKQHSMADSIWADSVRKYVLHLHNAICQLEKKAGPVGLVDSARECKQGGGEEAAPPKYPPR